MFSKDCLFLIDNESRIVEAIRSDTIYYERSYLRGQRHGVECEYINGQRTYYCAWKNNNRNGKKRLWYENGQKSYECNCNIFLNGLERHWYEGGEKEFECNWINGYKDGKAMRWFRDGRIMNIIHWNHGKLMCIGIQCENK